ncbi:CopD family protein [Halomonas sp. TRM85114]|nr:CopD family protein [Halomonas jincaotanensis]
MPWIKVLHIAALVCWCGTLLYLPAMIAHLARVTSGTSAFADEAPFMPHFLYTLVATPAALIAIISGTLLFLLNNIASGWLVLKLLAVAVMIGAHGACALLLVQLKKGHRRGIGPASLLTATFAGLSMLAVVGLVLAKPEL